MAQFTHGVPEPIGVVSSLVSLPLTDPVSRVRPYAESLDQWMALSPPELVRAALTSISG